MNEQEQEENLARLIRAGANPASRPDPALRQATLQRLQSELRAQRTQVQPQAAARTAREEADETTFFQPKANRVRLEQSEKTEIGRNTIMSKLFTRWGFGLTAATGVAAIVLIAVLAVPQAKGRAAEVMARGARAMAKLSSVHLRGQLRTAPQDNFSAIMPSQDFVTIEMWKQFAPSLKWRVEKPGRTAVMDGQSTILFIKPDYAVKVPRPAASAFDTDWFQQMADLSDTLEREAAASKAHGWPVTMAAAQGADGKAKTVITIEAKSGLADSDYLKNAFFMSADTKRVYVFDNQTELLEGVRIYLQGAPGEPLVFELNQIEFNQPLAPSVFQLQLPANVSWQQDMQVLPDNAKYAAMTPEQAARAFLEACGREDWAEAGKFMSPVSESFKQDRGGIQVLSIGKSFTSAISLINGAQFVPYEIKFKNGTINKHNLALKRDGRTGRWFVDGGI